MKDRARIRGTTPATEQAARQLRQQLTPAEAKLWSALRGRQLKGIKFRCQHPVGRFIVDFYCPTYKLAIDFDGDSHIQQADYDAARTEHLQSFGYRVLRFTNQMVIKELPQVLELIVQAAESEFPPELIPMAKSTFRNIDDDIAVTEAPQPPILGELEAGSPPELGDLGGLQPGCDIAKYFASSIRIGGAEGGQCSPSRPRSRCV